MVYYRCMNTKILEQTIKRLDERLKQLESWRAPQRPVSVMLDQRASDDEIKDLARARQVLKRTSGIISKKKAAEWLKDIKRSRALWNA